MLKSRLIVGGPLALLILLAVFWPGEAGAAIFAGIAGAGIYAAFTEFSSISEGIGIDGPHRALRYFGVALLLAIIYSPLAARGPTGMQFPVVIWPAELLILAMIVLYCFGSVFHAKNYTVGLNQAAMAMAGLVFVYGSLNFIVKIYFSNGLSSEGRYLLLFVAGSTKAADIGAYTAGMLTSRSQRGNHKIAPRISPKKSWEGLFGGIAMSIATAFILYALFGNQFIFCGRQVLNVWSAMAFGGLFGILGYFGDISESALKRAAHFDDSGSIPGLGGVLDMADSLLFVLPVFYAFLAAKAIF